MMSHYTVSTRVGGVASLYRPILKFRVAEIYCINLTALHATSKLVIRNKHKVLYSWGNFRTLLLISPAAPLCFCESLIDNSKGPHRVDA